MLVELVLGKVGRVGPTDKRWPSWPARQTLAELARRTNVGRVGFNST